MYSPARLIHLSSDDSPSNRLTGVDPRPRVMSVRWLAELTRASHSAASVRSPLAPRRRRSSPTAAARTGILAARPSAGPGGGGARRSARRRRRSHDVTGKNKNCARAESRRFRAPGKRERRSDPVTGLVPTAVRSQTTGFAKTAPALARLNTSWKCSTLESNFYFFRCMLGTLKTIQ